MAKAEIHRTSTSPACLAGAVSERLDHMCYCSNLRCYTGDGIAACTHHYSCGVDGNQQCSYTTHQPYDRRYDTRQRRFAAEDATRTTNEKYSISKEKDNSNDEMKQIPRAHAKDSATRRRSSSKHDDTRHMFTNRFWQFGPSLPTTMDVLWLHFICFMLINISFCCLLRHLPTSFPNRNNNLWLFASAQQLLQQADQSYLPSYYHPYNHIHHLHHTKQNSELHKLLPYQYHSPSNNNHHHHRHHQQASESNAMIELNFSDGDFSSLIAPVSAKTTVAAATAQPKSLKHSVASGSGSLAVTKQHQPSQLITYSELDYDMIPSSLAAAKPHPTINVKRDAQQQYQQNDNFRIMTPPSQHQNYYSNASSTFLDFNSNTDFQVPPTYPLEQPPPPPALDNSQWSQTYYFTPSVETPTTSTLSYSTMYGEQQQQQPRQPAQLLYRHNNNNVVANSNKSNKHHQHFQPRVRENINGFARQPLPPPLSAVPSSYPENNNYEHNNNWQNQPPPPLTQNNENQREIIISGGGYSEPLKTAESSTRAAPSVSSQQRNHKQNNHISQHSGRRVPTSPPPLASAQRPHPYDEIIPVDQQSINNPDTFFSMQQQPVMPPQSSSFLPPPLQTDFATEPFFGHPTTNFDRHQHHKSPSSSSASSGSKSRPAAELPLTCPVNSTQYLPTIVDACSVSSRALHPPGRMVSAAEAERIITHETNITCDGGISVSSLKWVFACIAAVPRHRVRLAIVGMRDAFVTFDSILPHGVAAEPSDYKNVKELRLENLYGLILPARLLDFFPSLEKFVLRGIDLGQSLPSSAFLQQPLPLDGSVNKRVHPLEELVIEHCKVEKLASDALLYLDHLKRVTMSDNNLVDLPFAALERMHNLQELDLSNNQLSLPPYQRVERLPPELRSLNLSGNLFADFPYRVVRQSGGKIQWLDVSRNRITFLKAKQLREDDRTQIIGKTKYMTHVDMSKNQVNLIGYPFTALFPAMTHFNMSSNSVPFVGPLLFSDQSQTLLNLDLSFNRISYVYQGLENLTNLQTLNLSTNRIDRMVSGSLAGARDSLRILHLDNNHLTRMPSAVSELNNLERLDLRGNRMVKFEPAELTSSDTTIEMLALPRSIEIRNVAQFDRFERLRTLNIPNANLVCNEHFLCRMIYELQGEHPAYCYVPPDHILHNRTNKGWMRVGDFVSNSTFSCPSRDLLRASEGTGDGIDGSDGRVSSNGIILVIATLVLFLVHGPSTSLGWTTAFLWASAAGQTFDDVSSVITGRRQSATAARHLLELVRKKYPTNSYSSTRIETAVHQLPVARCNEEPAVRLRYGIFQATHHRRQHRNPRFAFGNSVPLYLLLFLRVDISWSRRCAN